MPPGASDARSLLAHGGRSESNIPVARGLPSSATSCVGVVLLSPARGSLTTHPTYVGLDSRGGGHRDGIWAVVDEAN